MTETLAILFMLLSGVGSVAMLLIGFLLTDLRSRILRLENHILGSVPEKTIKRVLA